MRLTLLCACLLIAACSNHAPPPQSAAAASQASVVTFHIASGVDGWWTFPGEPPIYANTGFPNADLVRTITGSELVGFVPGPANFSPLTVDWDNAAPESGTAHWATVTGTGTAFTVAVTPIPTGSG